MIYLEKFIFPDIEHDTLINDEAKGSFYDEHSYPFHLTSNMIFYNKWVLTHTFNDRFSFTALCEIHANNIGWW